MGWFFKCKPDFGDMEFYEFLSKYEKLKERVKKEKTKSSGMAGFMENFSNLG